MDLKTAEEELKNVKLPAWVRGLSVAEEFDIDGNLFIRVWVKVDEGFDVERYDDEISEVEDGIRRHLWNAGTEEWVQVSLTDGVYPD
jgi:hypothetical protein